jgi:hypothetical protein
MSVTYTIATPASGNITSNVTSVEYYSGVSGAAQQSSQLTRISNSTIPASNSYFTANGVKKLAVVVDMNSSAFTLSAVVADRNVADNYNPGVTDGDFSISTDPVETITANDKYKVIFNTDALKIPSPSTDYYKFWLVFTDGSGNLNAVLISMTAGALPVTLSNFTAKQTTDNKVSLAWVTSSESVNKGFSIERQDEGSGKFQSLGFIASKAEGGNSQATLAYSFKDLTAKNGTNMYRLVQEDLDGKKTYSEVRIVKLSAQSVSSVFPNPSTGAINISRTNDGKKMNIQVLDQSGRVISQVNNITDANYRMNLPQSGIYSIKMMYPETGEQSIQRIVVQK